ncbi:DUF1223 domain-containing protein [Sphingomonas profundi]|uniref:DUF1223 domain-containing protein n=1 Tax=Alterirhizorhabdus profundi TaxID=2681549 RepID=UPI0012E8EBA4|nr:DUF1223 domain-containing protein [Sphingomonas profundi]
MTEAKLAGAPMAALVAAITLAAGPATAADPAHPAVVELFQSQGCSSCPPANANLNAIAGRPDVLALSFAVTYWDQLGWKDGFAQPAFTARQRDYARAAGRGNVATPQMIVNGRGAIVGGNPAQLADTIRRLDRPGGGPEIARAGAQVSIGAARGGPPATVWLVYYDPRTLAVAVKAGENAGRTLPHRNIVRTLAPVGTWTGAATRVSIPAPADPVWRGAILVQAGTGGPILAAARI